MQVYIYSYRTFVFYPILFSLKGKENNIKGSMDGHFCHEPRPEDGRVLICGQAKNSRPFVRNVKAVHLPKVNMNLDGIKDFKKSGNLLFRLVLCYWSLCIYFIVPFMLINQL